MLLGGVARAAVPVPLPDRDPDPDPDRESVSEPEPEPDVDSTDERIAETLAPDDTADDVLAAAELARDATPTWLAELADDASAFGPRHQRPSRLGRIDVSIAWRHAARDPRTRDPYSRDDLWLLATWRH